MENHWIQDWLSCRAESPKTKREYSSAIANFSSFCQARGKNFNSIVDDWRTAHYSGARAEQQYLDQWEDLIRGYSTAIKPKYAPLTQKIFLTVPKSFFSYYKIPIGVDLPRRPCVLYHNQDLTKQQLIMILSKASQRDKAIFLMMAESGLRANTIVDIKYWQIKEDYESGTVPLRILTPSATLKDHVGDRWSFIGEDGVRQLKEYLEPRRPLMDQDYIFSSDDLLILLSELIVDVFQRLRRHWRQDPEPFIGSAYLCDVLQDPEIECASTLVSGPSRIL